MNLKLVNKESHEVFKRTFLRKVSLGIKLKNKVSGKDFCKRMVAYLDGLFGMKVDHISEDMNRVEIASPDRTVIFAFELDGLQLEFHAPRYLSFSDSILPIQPKLTGFIEQVACAEEVASITLRKNNDWSISDKDVYANFSDMIRYSFNEHCIQDMLMYKVADNPQPPFRITKQGKNESPLEYGANLEVDMWAEITSKDLSKMGLDLQARVENVATSDIPSRMEYLNAILYQGFIETISPNIIHVMKQEE